MKQYILTAKTVTIGDDKVSYNLNIPKHLVGTFGIVSPYEPLAYTMSLINFGIQEIKEDMVVVFQMDDRISRGNNKYPRQEGDPIVAVGVMEDKPVKTKKKYKKSEE